MAIQFNLSSYDPGTYETMTLSIEIPNNLPPNHEVWKHIKQFETKRPPLPIIEAIQKIAQALPE